MKFILSILLLSVFASFTWAQIPGQVYVSSYDDTVHIVSFCKEKQRNHVLVRYILVNVLTPNSPVWVDSVVYTTNSDAFEWISTKKVNDEIGGVLFTGGPIYSPKRVGTDTITITAHYGAYTSTGVIVFHSEESPSIALEGIVIGVVQVNQYFGIGGQENLLIDDTLLNHMSYSYRPSTTPQYNGMNPNIVVRSCGGGTIDSIYTVGDFSEIEILNIPSLPHTMGEDDSLVLPFIFIPKHVGKFPHYLVFHTTEGKYLVWSFEYEVYPDLSTQTELRRNSSYQLYPNPANSSVTIGWQSEEEPEEIILIDGKGSPIRTVELGSGHQGQGTRSIVLDTDDLPNGSYSVLIRTSGTMEVLKLIISR